MTTSTNHHPTVHARPRHSTLWTPDGARVIPVDSADTHMDSADSAAVHMDPDTDSLSVHPDSGLDSADRTADSYADTVDVQTGQPVDPADPTVDDVDVPVDSDVDSPDQGVDDVDVQTGQPVDGVDVRVDSVVDVANSVVDDVDVHTRPDVDTVDGAGKNTRMRVDEKATSDMTHREALDNLDTVAAQVRYACEVLGRPTTTQVREWLEHYDISPDRSQLGRVVKAWREARALTDTADLPIWTEEVFAELEQQEDDVTPAESPAMELEARVRAAQARLALQDDPALTRALSDDELQAERDLAEWERETDRQIRRSVKEAELANALRAQAAAEDLARRERDTAEHLAKVRSDDERWHLKALSARRRLTSPDAKLARTHHRAEWSARALIGVVLLGMIWSGVNVQHNLVPDGDMANPLYWLSYGIEATISIPLIVIMIAATTAASWGKEEMSRTTVIPVELALLSITIGLNAGPHLFGEHANIATALENMVAPVMIGVVIWLHAWVSKVYATLVIDAPTATDDAQES